MLELIAQGSQPAHRWRRAVPEDRAVELGRTSNPLAVPWDSLISRRHVRLRFLDGRLGVQQLEDASNPVFFNGSQEDFFWLKPGEHFVIGETTFTLTTDRAEITLDVPHPISQKTFSPEFLRRVAYRDADRRIEVLNELPELISSAADETDLLTRIVNTLFAGIRSAATVGVVRQCDPSRSRLEVFHWDRRGNRKGDFHPSDTLIRQSLDTGESVLHIWKSTLSDASSGHETSAEASVAQPFTFDYENDWAFCCPLDSPATTGWAIYVAGINRPVGNAPRDDHGSASSSNFDSGTPDLQGDIKFCELVGSTLQNLLWMRQMERRQSALRNFFSPVVIQAVTAHDAEQVLAPRQCRVSVLFCDLRGFSRTSEKMADQLLELLDRVSESLGVTTSNILDEGGVVGDFHGDAVMGFWGWPLDEPESAWRAVKTAIKIRESFAQQADTVGESAQDFHVGLGIATGEAVAGKIGTRDQVKVTAFGPVVNLAARLESLTRKVDCSILTDETTANEAVASNSDLQVRKLASIQPFGLDTAQAVYQIVPDNEKLSNEQLNLYAKALTDFTAGEWPLVQQTLLCLPANDTGRKFLTEFMESHEQQVPVDWNGTIQLRSK